MFKLIDKLIIQEGSSIIRINISPNTNSAKNISLIGVDGAPPCCANVYSPVKWLQKPFLIYLAEL